MDFSIESFEHIQTNKSIVPLSALITYQNQNIRGEQEFFIAKHSFESDSNDEFILGEAQIVSIEEQHQIARAILNTQLQKNILIDENVLSYSKDSLIWFVKSKVWTMNFSMNGKTKTVSVPMPPHVICVKNKTISLYSLKKNKRPTADTALFISPIPNVYSSNNLCTGSVTFPTNPTQKDIPEIERGIFNTFNTHSHIQSVKNIATKDHVKFLVSLDKQPKFKTKGLLPTKQTLKSII